MRYFTRRFAGAIAFALLIPSIPAFAQTVSFLSPQFYRTGTNPQSVAAGDFNRDGAIDLVSADSSSNTVSLFLGNGDGTFQNAISIPVDPSPFRVVAADFNNDGRLDLAIAHDQNNRVSILLGNGNGGFSAPITFNTTGSPYSLAVGDMNRDGIADLVVCNNIGPNNGSGNVEVFLGNGDGTFLGVGTWGPGSPPSPVFAAIGDLNGDGIPDVVAATNSDPQPAVILFGNGDGTLRFGPTLPGTAGYGSIALGDFNGDGIPDIAGRVYDYESGHIVTRLGNRDGTFQTPQSLSAGSFPWFILAADLNGDGAIDLAVTNADSNDISIFAGNGDGTFLSSHNFPVASGPYAATFADLNGDGRLDVITANTNEYSIAVLMNNLPPSGSIWTTPSSALAGVNSLRKFGGCDGCDDAGATTKKVVESGDAYAEFSFDEVTGLRMVGFASSFSSAESTIEFGIRIQNGYAEVRESGAYRSDIRAEPNAVFRIAVQNGVVTYAKNGSVFYTSTTLPRYPFQFAAALASSHAGVQAVNFTDGIPAGGGGGGGDGIPHPAEWTDSQNVLMDGNSVRKTTGCDDCWDAFVIAGQHISASGGYVEFTAGPNGPLMVAGLTHAYTINDPLTFDYGLRFQNWYVEVREVDIYETDVPFVPGDTFRITVNEGVVSYSKNGQVFYTSATTTSDSLFFMGLFASYESSVQNVVISSNP